VIVHVSNKQISFAVVGDAFGKVEQRCQCFAVLISFLCSARDVLCAGVDNVITCQGRYLTVRDSYNPMQALICKKLFHLSY
jgi:hypothetical protein